MGAVQQPLGSGFGAATTVSDLISGVDLTGKSALVTGANSGLGLETAKAFAGAGAHVIVADRELDVARHELASYDVDFGKLDLVDPASIDAFAEHVLQADRPLHIQVNAAGIMGPPLLRDSRGNEMQLSTNHLGHFQLTARLWSALARAGGARVVAYSSLGHQYAPVEFDDVNFERRDYDRIVAYGQSKTAVALFAIELDARGKGDGVRAFAVHPGNIFSTNLGRYLLDTIDVQAAGFVDDDGNPIIDPDRQLKSPEQGAATGVWCATSEQLNGLGGVYCEDCDIAALDLSTEVLDFYDANDARGVKPYAVDPHAASRLWALSEGLTGIQFL